MGHFADIDPLAEGMSGSDFRNELNAIISQIATNVEAGVPYTVATNDALWGQGIIQDSYTPALVVAGTGLAANVGEHEALIGYVIDQPAAIIALPASSTRYLWEMQDGSLEITSTAVNPGTVDLPAIPLATLVTDGTHVTSVTETFTLVRLPVALLPLFTANKYLGTNADGEVVVKTDPLTSYTETDPLSLHMTASGLTPSKYIGTDSSGNVVVKTDPLTSFSESDPVSLHLSGGTMSGAILSTDVIPVTNGSNILGDVSHYWGGIYTNAVLVRNIGAAESVSLYDNTGTHQGGLNTTDVDTLEIKADHRLMLTADALTLNSVGDFTLNVPTDPSASAGAGGALPATVEKYLTVKMGADTWKIALYAP